MVRLVPPPSRKEGITSIREPLTAAYEQILERRNKQDKGPRKRDAGETENKYAGKNIRIDFVKDQVDGDRYYLDSTKPLDHQQQNMAVAAGFDPIGDMDTALHWEATRENVARSGKDINVLAITLDGKQERVGRSR